MWFSILYLLASLCSTLTWQRDDRYIDSTVSQLHWQSTWKSGQTMMASLLFRIWEMVKMSVTAQTLFMWQSAFTSLLLLQWYTILIKSARLYANFFLFTGIEEKHGRRKDIVKNGRKCPLFGWGYKEKAKENLFIEWNKGLGGKLHKKYKENFSKKNN